MARRRQLLASALALRALTIAPPGAAAASVRIGALYPLTGNSASAGQEAKAALAVWPAAAATAKLQWPIPA